MTRRKQKIEESATHLLAECLNAGAYYFFRAEGPDENLVSAMNRMKYRDMVQRFEYLHIPLPTQEEFYDCAAAKWPKHKLHPAPAPLDGGVK